MDVAVRAERPVKINRSTIETVWKRRQEGARLVVRDAACPGLTLVVNPKGMVWRFAWRPRGFDAHTGRRWPSQSLTIGTPESHSPDAARDEAGRLKGRAKAGSDPGADRRQRIATESRQRASTVERLIDVFERELPGRPKLRGTGPLGPEYANAELAHLRAAVKDMNVLTRPIADVTLLDIGKMLAARVEQPATARKHFGALSRFLDFAVEHGHIDLNPCLRLPKGKRPRPVRSRTTCPTLPDLAAIWHAAGAERAGPPAKYLSDAERDLVRWLILTPCRLREATRMDWRQIDLQAALWRLPAAMSKNREPHDFHLHGAALALLQARHAAAGQPSGGLVFPAERSRRDIKTFTAIKRHLTTVSRVKGWTFHDFRRSFASACAELGVAEAVADAVLSHKQSATRGGVLGVYQRSRRWPDQVDAVNRWGAAIAPALEQMAVADYI